MDNAFSECYCDSLSYALLRPKSPPNPSRPAKSPSPKAIQIRELVDYSFQYKFSHTVGLEYQLSFVSRIKDTKLALKTWNKEIFGNVHMKINKLNKQIQEVQAITPDDCRSLEYAHYMELYETAQTRENAMER